MTDERLRMVEERLAAAEREVRKLRRRGPIAAAVILTIVAAGFVFADAWPSNPGGAFSPNPPAWLYDFGRERGPTQITGGKLGVTGSLRVGGSLTLQGPIRMLGPSGKTVVEISASRPGGAITLKDAAGRVIFHAP